MISTRFFPTTAVFSVVFNEKNSPSNIGGLQFLSLYLKNLKVSSNSTKILQLVLFFRISKYLFIFESKNSIMLKI